MPNMGYTVDSPLKGVTTVSEKPNRKTKAVKTESPNRKRKAVNNKKVEKTNKKTVNKKKKSEKNNKKYPFFE